MRFFENKKVNLGMVEFRGVENGVSVTYTFELKGGEWFLVEMEDFSI
jgi:hydrogenase maturation factor